MTDLTVTPVRVRRFLSDTSTNVNQLPALASASVEAFSELLADAYTALHTDPMSVRLADLLIATSDAENALRRLAEAFRDARLRLYGQVSPPPPPTVETAR